MAQSSDKSPPKDLNENELKFVDEYLIDRDPYEAALRVGVAKVVLKKTVQKWMSNASILKAIQIGTDSVDVGKMVTPQRIMAGFMEVAFDRNAPAAARNTALRELASLNKMYEDDDDKKKSGVILVPVAGSLSEWQQMAANAQAKLKEDVRS